MFGRFNIAATLLNPPDIKSLARVKLSVRRTCELNGEVGCYDDTLTNDYVCVFALG